MNSLGHEDVFERYESPLLCGTSALWLPCCVDSSKWVPMCKAAWVDISLTRDKKKDENKYKFMYQQN
jgi:hypothetical protein